MSNLIYALLRLGLHSTEYRSMFLKENVLK
jgi:hypothetical protein